MFFKTNKLDFKDIELPANYDKLTHIQRKRVREQYTKNQNGRCCYCNNKLTEDPPDKILKLKIHLELFPVKFFDWPIHLHHNHNTGKTVGAVHSWCNSVLWEYENE